MADTDSYTSKELTDYACLALFVELVARSTSMKLKYGSLQRSLRSITYLSAL